MAVEYLLIAYNCNVYFLFSIFFLCISVFSFLSYMIFLCVTMCKVLRDISHVPQYNYNKTLCIYGQSLYTHLTAKSNACIFSTTNGQ